MLLAKPWQGSTLFNWVNYLSWFPVTAYIVLILIRVLSPETILISPLADEILVRLSFHLNLVSYYFIALLAVFENLLTVLMPNFPC